MIARSSSYRLPPWVGILIVVMAVVVTGQAAWQANEQQTCNEAFARNLEARVRWNNEDRVALNRLIISVFENDTDRAQFKAYQQWRRVSLRNEERRQSQPLPVLAECD